MQYYTKGSLQDTCNMLLSYRMETGKGNINWQIKAVGEVCLVMTV